MKLQDDFEDFMDTLGRDWFDGKVAGVTYCNEDGSERQTIARHLVTFDELYLRCEPDNPFDKTAIAVLSPGGNQVGYLESRLAAEQTRRFRRGEHARCFVRAVRESRGVVGVSFGLVRIAG